jgi:hypothetical protein
VLPLSDTSAFWLLIPIMIPRLCCNSSIKHLSKPAGASLK